MASALASAPTHCVVGARACKRAETALQLQSRWAAKGAANGAVSTSRIGAGRLAQRAKRSMAVSAASSNFQTAPVATPSDVIAALVAASVAAVSSALRQVSEKLRAVFSPMSAQEQALFQKWNLHKAHHSKAFGAACFAAISQSADSAGSSTPLTVIASGMAKWLELYSGLLLIRVLLSWFPNIDWERQPLQAVRDMSDPYLNLFRNIMMTYKQGPAPKFRPPFFGALDLSPMLAFLVLGILTSLLNTTVFS